MSHRWPPLILLLAGCRLGELLPEGPVLDPAGRQLALAAHGQPSRARYVGEALLDVPVLPVMVWGAAYDRDLVLVTRHPRWDMHEIARLQTPDGPVWLVKEARLGTLDQEISADLPDLHALLPELPVARHVSPVHVDDRSTDRRLDLAFAWTNPDGEAMTASYRGPVPQADARRRNGSTMGHSREQVLAVLDLEGRRFGSRARVTADGRRLPIARLAGLMPFRMALIQAQAGLAVADLVQAPTDDGFRLTHALPASEPETTWTLREVGPHTVAEQVHPWRTLAYTFRDRELIGAEVRQWGREAPVLRMRLSPALPDLGRRFEGAHRSRYVLDVNGQESHAVGWLEARWTEAGPVVDLLPDLPWWTADRPMRTQILYDGASASVVIERLPTDARSGRGARGISPIPQSSRDALP